MLLNGRCFDGSTEMMATYRLLRSTLGNATWFSEFPLLNDTNIEAAHRLLSQLQRKGNDLCCFLTDSYVYHLAGFHTDSSTAILFVALTDCIAVRLLFQRYDPRITTFHIHDFLFTLVDNGPYPNSFIYHVSSDQLSITLTVLGIAAVQSTNPLSNVDFVYYVWERLERFSFRRHALTLLPAIHEDDPSRLLCLRHYRARSDGWREFTDCRVCVSYEWHEIRHIVGCLGCHQRALPCTCPICTRRPPSLRDIALHTVYNTLSFRDFELHVDTTYDMYRRAVFSGQATARRLLPPYYPFVDIRCHSPRASSYPRFHLHCRVEGVEGFLQLNIIQHHYSSAIDAITDIVNDRRVFWCATCDKSLFFPVSCYEHGHYDIFRHRLLCYEQVPGHYLLESGDSLDDYTVEAVVQPH